MKILIERMSNDNNSWIIMIQDELGKRPYVSIKFGSPDEAFNYITKKFTGCLDFSDIEFKIIPDLK